VTPTSGLDGVEAPQASRAQDHELDVVQDRSRGRAHDDDEFIVPDSVDDAQRPCRRRYLATSEFQAATCPRCVREPTDTFDPASRVGLRRDGVEFASGRALAVQATPCHATAGR